MYVLKDNLHCLALIKVNFNTTLPVLIIFSIFLLVGIFALCFKIYLIMKSLF